MSKYKVLIGCTAYGRGNIGDEAIVHAIVQNLTAGSGIDRQHIKVLTAKPKQLRERLKVSVGSPRFRFCAKEFVGAEFVVCGGATILSDYTNYFFAKSLIAVIMRKKVVYFGIGANEIAMEYLTRLLIRIGMRFAKLVTVRDEQTKKQLQKLGIKREIFVMGDPAHSIKEAEPNKINEFFNKHGIEKREKYLVIGLSGEPDFRDQIPVDEIANAVKKISERYNLVPIYLAMNFNLDQDRLLLEQVYKKNNNYGILIAEDVEPEIVFSLLEYAKLIISTRLHLVILGTTKAVPAIGIARGNKMNNLLGQLKLKVMPSIKDITEDSLVAEADRIIGNYEAVTQDIRNGILDIMQKNQKGFSLLKELLFNQMEGNEKY